jgi:hypothetical protein
MKEASAMTEASGLVNEQDGIEQTSDALRRPLQSPSQDAAIRWAERLRKVTVCQSALEWDPLSASKRDPFDRRVLLVALAASELVGVAETARARVA